MNYTRIDTLTSPRVAIIDLDTGTLLGTNLVMAYIPEDMEDELNSSDSAAHDHGVTYGIPLFVESTLDG